MITSNYGLWNAYVLVTMLLYLPHFDGEYSVLYVSGCVHTLVCSSDVYCIFLKNSVSNNRSLQYLQVLGCNVYLV